VTNLDLIDGLITAALATGGFALTILAALAAALIAGIGYRAGTAIATRYQARQLVRYCQLYLLDDLIRAALDTNYQPRKED
jgi:hypothetical protein